MGFHRKGGNNLTVITDTYSDYTIQITGTYKLAHGLGKTPDYVGLTSASGFKSTYSQQYIKSVTVRADETYIYFDVAQYESQGRTTFEWFAICK